MSSGMESAFRPLLASALSLLQRARQPWGLFPVQRAQAWALWCSLVCGDPLAAGGTGGSSSAGRPTGALGGGELHGGRKALTGHCDAATLGAAVLGSALVLALAGTAVAVAVSVLGAGSDSPPAGPAAAAAAAAAATLGGAGGLDRGGPGGGGDPGDGGTLTSWLRSLIEPRTPSLSESLFNLKFTAKQLQRQSKKSNKDEAEEKAKLKKALQQGNMDGARIYAANAIRKKNEALNLLRLASRIDAVASRVQTAVTMRKVTQSMTGVVKGMDKAMESMNLEQISMVMDKFEKQFEDLDVQTEYMENAMGQTTALTTPQDQVEELMQQVADANGLELQMEMPGAGRGTLVGTATVEKEHDALGERLAKLRNG